MVRRAALRLVGALLFALALAGCSCSGGQGKVDAEAAVVVFHRELDAGNFAAIYAAAHPELKTATTEKDFVALLESIHRKLGPIRSSSQQGWRVGSYNFEVNVSLGYKTTFTGGDATESFVYRIDGRRAALLGYNINSLALVTK